MRIEIGRAPWEPDARASAGEAWHFWDHPRWGWFELDGVLVAFHRHESVGEWRDGPSFWTYRVLDPDDRRALDLPEAMWGAPWQRAYDAWRARTAAQWWAITDADLAIVRSGELEPAAVDDEEWAEAFARAHGITGT